MAVDGKVARGRGALRTAATRSVLVSLLLLGAAAHAQPAVHPLPFTEPYVEAHYAFLREAVGARTLVQLADPLRVSEEGARARLPLVRYLHEALGFDLLALEGSPLDAWLAMELLYDPGGSAEARLARAQDLAWFAPYQTPGMRALLAYVQGTQGTAHPLYLTSFDVQPGVARAYLAGWPVFDALFAALARYAPRPPEAVRWRVALEDLVACRAKGFPDTAASEREALEAIAGVERWIAAAQPSLRAARPALHAAALARVPEALRARVELCSRDLASGERREWTTYLAARDALAARHALALRALAPGGRVLLWTHQAQALPAAQAHGAPTFGALLQRAAPGQLYTVGLFVGEGRGLEVEGRAVPPFAERALAPAGEGSAEALLARVTGGRSAFVDLRGLTAASAPDFFRPLPSRSEVRGQAEVVLARDLGAALYLPQVSAPRLLFASPRLQAAIRAAGYAQDHGRWLFPPLMLAVIALLVHRVRRRQRVPPEALRPRPPSPSGRGPA
ncbi:erythromycin esterase family protein [Aggregicoccus sp. 17bor-14]|uniref:erythromycin esterase family protein n=1 Tax=Myxococcaceae TaxID=31 RepID=UPI00129CE387|nr:MULTISPECIES: erythromycin esterase family protein [Myxococcaceae]MBF5045952.1 erythromycin esterase family protein [Simulacricoccus sp. 17bor-14]MRI91684.1 erythromycin esterase family protein [Aggregicoccus sp. 17bor-14]